MNILFCNSKEPVCGVYQYGVNLFSSLAVSTRNKYIYAEPDSAEETLRLMDRNLADVLIVNWHPDMGGWQVELPFKPEVAAAKQILIYHDWNVKGAEFDAVLFSDPTIGDYDNWKIIPRPLPRWNPISKVIDMENPKIGVHGFYGASAHMLTEQVVKEFDTATVRLHLPYAHFGDPSGEKARDILARCHETIKSKPGITIEANHEFLTTTKLLEWLSENDINCYFRDTEAEWKGVSSALDSAMAVQRPLAVNKCKGFRHVHNLEPSICIEDRSIREIIASGISPLLPLYQANSVSAICNRVDDIVEGLTK